jgi:dTDP-4-amino-4,6-dideoxygalactose transaminase
MKAAMAIEQIPLVDLSAQYKSIRRDVDEAIQRVFDTTTFIMGPEVEAFEASFASYTGTRFAVGVASGTAALHLALQACGIAPGDEVITAAHTFIATAEPISNLGAVPVFADIDLDTYTVDPAQVEALIGPKTKAIIPVHLYGHPAHVEALRDIADRHGLWLIEDAAQAHAAEYEGRRIGSFGDLACFSFYPGKNLGAYGDAGAVVGSDSELISRVRTLRDHGRSSKYEHVRIGSGERLDAIQAAVLAAKLRHLDDWTTARRRHAERYRARMADLPVSLPIEAAGAKHVYHLFVIRAADRDGLLAALRRAGIGAGVHYPIPLHMQPAYRRTTYRMANLLNTELAARSVLSLPMYPELSDSQIDRVTDAVRRFLS